MAMGGIQQYGVDDPNQGGGNAIVFSALEQELMALQQA